MDVNIFNSILDQGSVSILNNYTDHRSTVNKQGMKRISENKLLLGDTKKSSQEPLAIFIIKSVIT